MVTVAKRDLNGIALMNEHEDSSVYNPLNLV